MRSRMIRSISLAPLSTFLLFGIVLFSAVTATAQGSLVDVATLSGDFTGDQFGISVSGAGDVNNDGLSDLIVGASANDDGGDAAGKAYIFLGSTGIGPGADWSFSGQAVAGFLGASVAGVGDVNNDGFDDVLIGAPFNNDLGSKTGKALLFFGGSPMDSTPDLVFYGAANLDQFGAAVAGLGDVNGDGFADWAIGAFKADSGTQSNTGIVHVYFGGATPDSVADVSIFGKAVGERFGISIGGCGRFNADSYDDFIVGAYGYDGSAGTNVGRAYVFFGGTSPDTAADVIMTGENAHDFFGYSVAGVGDVDADSFDDILIGAKGYDYGSSTDAGKVYLFLGSTSPDNTADFTATAGQNNSDEYGTAVSGAGDIDGDGTAEFLVGADRDNTAGNDAGKAYLYQGAVTPPFVLDTTFLGQAADARLGCALANVGAMNADLYTAFAIGALAHANSTGVVYIIGSPDTSSAANQAPVLTPIGAKQVPEGSHLEFRVTATDPDGTIPGLSAVDLPVNASFHDSLNGAGGLVFDPAAGQAGAYDVLFIASDGILADSELVTITVSSGTCSCPLQSDFDANNQIDAVDLGGEIDAIFFGGTDPSDPDCPTTRGDFNNDGFTDAVDLGGVIDHVFFGGVGPTDPCQP